MIKQNEIALRKSGLLAQSSFDALADSAFQLYERLMMNITVRSRGNVSFKMASELSANMASTMLSPIYAQMNPDTIGSENRDLNIATEYGSRLAKDSRNAKANAVYRLVHHYPSHDFVIDQKEAKTLFKNVDHPTECLYEIVGALGDAAYNEAASPIVCALSQLAKEEQGLNDQVTGSNAKEALDGGGNPDSASAPEPGLGGGGSGPAAANAEESGTKSREGTSAVEASSEVPTLKLAKG